MNPVNEEWWDVHVVEFPDHLVALDGVEGRAEVNEEESGKVPGGFKVLEE